MNWRDIALVAAGGALGSIGRYLIGRLMGPQADSSFPWHTLVVNVSGAFIIGLLIVTAARQGWPGWWRPLVAVGVLGGYTTFSTFSLESVELVLHGRALAAVTYSVGSLVAGLLACALGIALGRVL